MGNLELIIGPMYSSKSTEIISRYRTYQIINKKVLIVNHIKDKERNNDKGIQTHDSITCPAFFIDKLFTKKLF